jgi:Tfp pilus assembly protein PilE
MKWVAPPSQRAKGLTIMEMVGVLAVIAIVTALLIPKVFETINTARIHATVATINRTRDAVASHYARYGSFADSTGHLLLPSTVAASVDAANFDSHVLLQEGMLSKRFSVKVGDQVAETNRVIVRQVEPAATAADVTVDSASYDLDAAGVVETNDGALVCECIITGVSAADAHSLKVQIDGASLAAAISLKMGDAPVAGRVKYPAIGPGETGEVRIYLMHK